MQIEQQTHHPETHTNRPLWQEVHSFTNRPELRNLLTHFGYVDFTFPVIPEPEPTPEKKTALRLRHMSRFMSTNAFLNPRGGKERQDATELILTKKQIDLILQTADSLKMREGTSPSKENYEALVALGAGGAHAYERVAYLQETQVTGNTIYCIAGDMLYGTKPIEAMQKMPPKKDLEQEQRRQAYITKILSLKERYADQIPEFEFMLAAAEATYGEKKFDGTYTLGQTYTVKFEHGDKIVTYPASQGHPELVLVETHNKKDKTKRATSDDTYIPLQRELKKRKQHDILMSTNGVFQPFQDAAAKRILHDMTVETIGFAMEKTPSFDKPEKYVQEITAAVIENHKLADTLV